MKKLLLLLSVLMLASICMVSCGSKADDTPFSPGTFDDVGYVSEWLGLSFTPTDVMEMSSEDELAALMSSDDDAYYTDEATGEQKLDYDKLSTVYEMLATDTETEGSVLIMAQCADEGMTVESYIETIKSQLDEQLSLEEELGQASYSELTEKKLAGRTYTVFEYTLESYGITLGQTMYIQKIGDRMANICFTYGDDAELDSFLECFSKK